MDEKKLIDSDDFAKRLNGALAEFANRIEMPIEERLRLLVIVAKLFQYQPEVDAVPVVRCKDCSVPHNDFTGCPMVYGRIVGPNWFCGDGIRKDGEQNG